jgi:hypothetical protein
MHASLYYEYGMMLCINNSSHLHLVLDGASTGTGSALCTIINRTNSKRMLDFVGPERLTPAPTNDHDSFKILIGLF